MRDWPAVIYAIGDIHGCLSELEALERQIVADAAGVQGGKWIVTLGDYVDRGPRSDGVLDHLIAPPPPGFERICLAGNHEAMLLDYLTNPTREAAWLKYGGLETLASYGIETGRFVGLPKAQMRATLEAHIPQAHIDFMQSLPILLTLPDLVFVHAGLNPALPFTAQSDADLLWMREPFLSTPETGLPRVVHGHTPGPEPVRLPHRIGLDTGAFATGVLTAARLRRDAAVRFLQTGSAAANLL
ncbi:metallophosphoesterase family protein [Devosia limi]|nr:metallophosphoesterase family protein [Devosia limi]